jgi:hypothetical protein
MAEQSGISVTVFQIAGGRQNVHSDAPKQGDLGNVG